MGRLATILFLLTAIFIALAWFAQVPFTVSNEVAVKRELRGTATTEDLARRIDAALDRDDIADAEIYVEIAAYLGRDLPPATRARFETATGAFATTIRGAGDFAAGFVTGEAETTAGMAGALTSDLTVIGDVRDIMFEGARMLAGEDYSELLLGLSVVGLAATTATIATGGAGAPARAAISVMKAAKRAGAITADFAKQLGRLAGRAVDFNRLRRTLRQVDLANPRATQEAMTAYARSVRQAELFPVLARVGDMSAKVGPAETVRLMKYVRSTDELGEVAAMTTRLGKKSRGVIELTGKTSLRAFKTTLNVAEFILENILAFLTWLGGLLAAMAGRSLRFVGRSILRVRLA